MDLVDASPARRKGERNFRDPGRDWGENSHILPGRRVNEPNHEAWKNRVSLRLNYPYQQLPHDGRRDKETLVASKTGTNKPESATRWQGLGDGAAHATGDALYSLSRVIGVLEGMRSVVNDNSFAPCSTNHVDGARGIGADDLPKGDRATKDDTGWSSEVILQVSQMWERDWTPAPNHGSEARRYGMVIKACNQNLHTQSHSGNQQP
ncbi:hypothetical protein LPB41_02955 [Thalassospira sp. MA62]|nr:hypothetical protein [Thalassospira sp. MA62]